MAKVTLPALPKDKEFEEFLAAYLQASGRFVERTMIDRQEAEVLELDVLATEYKKGAAPEHLLLEAKSGKWGFEDIFKLRGWLHYLNFPRAALLVSKTHDHFEFHKKIGDTLQVSVVAVPDLSNATVNLAPIGVAANVKEEDVLIWRFSYWVERQLTAWLKAKKKSAPDCKRYAALDRYLSLVNNRAFFTKNVVQRAYELYSAFQEYPNVSAKAGHEMGGGEFDEDHEKIPKGAFDACYYNGKLNDICISTYVENRSRLAVMKSAIDYKVYKDTGSDQNEKLKIEFGDKTVEYTLLDTLPRSFKAGLEKISSHAYFHRYPVFWQWFLWFFGGFILLEYKDQEYSLLSEKTGIPVGEIDNALSAYEALFPRSGGWFRDVETVRILQLVPPPFMGVGANYRRLVYAEDKKFEGFKVTGTYAKRNLVRFNNIVVELLTWKS